MSVRRCRVCRQLIVDNCLLCISAASGIAPKPAASTAASIRFSRFCRCSLLDGGRVAPMGSPLVPSVAATSSAARPAVAAGCRLSWAGPLLLPPMPSLLPSYSAPALTVPPVAHSSRDAIKTRRRFRLSRSWTSSSLFSLPPDSVECSLSLPLPIRWPLGRQSFVGCASRESA